MTTVRQPESYAPYINLEIRDPKVANVFISVFREMAVSSMGDNEFLYAEDCLHIANEMNEARNQLLDLIAKDRDNKKFTDEELLAAFKEE